MTTPRDAIGLSERLRTPIWNEDTMKQWDSWRRMIAEMRGASLPRDCFETFLDNIDEERAEAATALDALQGEISQWANEVARYKAYAEKFDEENAALQARVKELEASNRTANKWQQWAEDERAKYEARATSAEQQRDEAYERAAKHFEESEHLVWSNDEAADAIRRLAAGTEKEEK